MKVVVFGAPLSFNAPSRSRTQPHPLKNPFSSQRVMQTLIHASETDWTIVQPPRLLNVAGNGRFRVDKDALPAGGARIARADAAAFMLAQLSTTEWVRQSTFIAW